MTPLFLQYPACSTCQKAKKWLTENNIEYTNRLIVEENPTVEELKAWIPRSGLPIKKFFNTSGLVYKELKLSEKLPSMSEEEQIELLATNGKLVKRPLVVTDSFVLVGFKPDEWEKLKAPVSKTGCREFEPLLPCNKKTANSRQAICGFLIIASQISHYSRLSLKTLS